MVRVGDVIGKQWVIVHSLGEGGQGTVWAAHDLYEYLKRTNRRMDYYERSSIFTPNIELPQIHKELGPPRYAIKFLAETNDQAVARFEQEIEALKTLDSRHIPKLHNFGKISHGKQPASYYLVEDLVYGTTLNDYVLKEQPYRNNLIIALNAFYHLCLTISYAHGKNIIHRDLKPTNIIITKDHNAVVLDFGICFFVGGERHTMTGEKVGPSHLMPPELASGPVHPDKLRPANDIFLLGKILYFMLSGGRELPYWYHEKQEYDLRINGPSQMKYVYEIFNRTICEDLNDRLQSVDLLMELIEEIVDKIAEELYPMQMGGKCLVCKNGYYRMAEIQGLDSIKIKMFGRPGFIDGLLSWPVVLICSECSNIQVFGGEEFLNDMALEKKERGEP